MIDFEGNSVSVSEWSSSKGIVLVLGDGWFQKKEIEIKMVWRSRGWMRILCSWVMDCEDSAIVLVLWMRYRRSVSVRKWSIPKGIVLVLGDGWFQDDWVQRKEIQIKEKRMVLRERWSWGRMEGFVIMSDPSHSVSVRKWLISREIVLVLAIDRVQKE